MRPVGLTLAAFFVVGLAVHAPASHCCSSHAITGDVSYIAKEHTSIKVKADDKTSTLLVREDAPSKAKLVEQIRKLKVGQAVNVSYSRCEHTGKLYITRIEKPKAEG